MGETANTAEIASKISKDIFDHFLWKSHPKPDTDFSCTNTEHKTSGGDQKKNHPGDIVFFYEDPYEGKTIYLHTDLKSYGKESVTASKIRGALRSLCWTIECARESEHWRSLYSVPNEERIDVQGLLFVHNHDHGFEKDFSKIIEKVDLSALPVSENTYIHFLGPENIAQLYSIGNDLIRLQFQNELSQEYTFYYPDLVMWKRQSDVWGQPATIETLTSPYFIIKHKPTAKIGQGYLVYYNRPGDCAEEFEYLIDSLSRFQILEPDELIRIRSVSLNPNQNMRSNFETAKKKYAKAWGFDSSREKILIKLTIDPVVAMADTYNPGFVGWND